ncbi:MAG: carbon starvation protein A [Phycisphaeraceae bacterium]|nr:carbon starvation protein A [Phycisphaeraceae bacterium]
MSTLLIALAAGAGFLVAYHTYGRWLGSKIFELSADVVCPSERLRDDTDYVPTSKAVVFGHHFTSIAGTGPIVGPAIAVMWGWVPALLWVVFGSIFIGAVHDFGSLVVSLRHNGQTVGDVAGRVLNKRVRVLFLFVLFMALTIVLAIFGLVIAAVFKIYPATIFPVMIQIPLAVIIGLWLHRQGINLTLPSLIALALMYLAVALGNWGPLATFNSELAGWSMMTWCLVLLGYSAVASVIPVWTLLQPRDYINSLQLITALGLVVVGLAVAAVMGGAPAEGETTPSTLEIVAPAWDFEPSEAPMIFPFLFITIACGAISGFHCLVSSGTSSKQLEREPHARFVGFGAMLTEGFLATIVILACVAGLGLGIAGENGLITGEAAWAARYSSWTSAQGLGAKVGAFVDGAGNFLMALGLPREFAVALMGVLVASFAGTTLDTATRLQRYVVQELASTFAPRVAGSAGASEGYDYDDNLENVDPDTGAAADHRGHVLNPLYWLTDKYVATLFAVVIAALMAGMPLPGKEWAWANAGKGGLILWPMFGATNQLLGGLAFLVITFFLLRRNKPIFFLVLPLLFMLVMPAWALIYQLFFQGIGMETGWLYVGQGEHNWLLIVIALGTLLLEIWMIIEGVLLLPKVRGVLEAQPRIQRRQEISEPTPEPQG